MVITSSRKNFCSNKICITKIRTPLLPFETQRASYSYTGWFKETDSISYIYISWTIIGVWMIYMTFEGEGPKFSNTTARALAWRTAVQQCQLRAKGLLCSTRFFAFVSSLKLRRRLLYSVRFVFVSTFSLQRGRAFVVGITNLSK